MNRQWGAYQRGGSSSAQRTNEACDVHILDAIHGLRIEKWIIGERVKRETHDKFKDGKGNLYMVVAYEKGEPNAMFVADSDLIRPGVPT